MNVPFALIIFATLLTWFLRPLAICLFGEEEHQIPIEMILYQGEHFPTILPSNNSVAAINGVTYSLWFVLHLT